MRRYCKAYHLRDLQQFQGWEELASHDHNAASDAIVYLWDDYTVARSPIHHDSSIVAQTSPRWQEFCTQALKFVIPTDIQTAPDALSLAGETPR